MANDSGRLWKEPAKRVTPPYAKSAASRVEFLSTSGHEKSWGKLGGPSSKAKYYLTTDSELVP